jgi:hypothetical protein
MENIGKYIVGAGVVLIIIGIVIWLWGNKLSWFGNLPGDIKIEREGFRFYAPIVSMLLLSIFFSLMIWLVKKFL